MLGFGLFDFLLWFGFMLIIVLWMRSRRPIDYPPGPNPLPIIGNIHNITGGHIVTQFRKLRKKYGDIFSVSIGHYWVIGVNNSENLRELLVKKGEYTSDRPPFYLMELLKNKGIVSASGQNWKHQRSFTISKLRGFGFGKKSFESSIMTEIEAFMDLLDSHKGQPFELTGILNTSMTNNVMCIVIGRRFEYDDPELSRFEKIVNDLLSNTAVSGLVNYIPWLAHIPGDPFGVFKLEKQFQILYDYFQKEITTRMKNFDDESMNDFTDVYIHEIMKQEGPKSGPFTEDQLLSILVDLFGAATETTATTIRWAILYLLRNKDIQDKMRKEIDVVIGPGRLPSLSDIPNMSYTEAVITETLRLGNIGPLALPHMVTENVTYKGYTIPKGSVIVPCLDSVVYDEELFPNCHEFIPERFIDSDGHLCGQDKVHAFSIGRRICPGESLARSELFLYLTTLVQRYLLLPPEGKGPPPTDAVLGTTNAPKPFMFRVIPRN